MLSLVCIYSFLDPSRYMAGAGMSSHMSMQDAQATQYNMMNALAQRIFTSVRTRDAE